MRVGRTVALTAAALLVLACLRVAFRDVPMLAGDAEPGAALGVFHVHSDSSHDGRLPAAEMLEGADRIGLDFVIFTDHEAQPDHAAAAGGPLAVPGTELSTPFGHLIYLGYDAVPGPGPMRSGVGVIDSLTSRGAFTVLAHPVSPRRPWLGRRPGIGGLEIASTSDDARIAAAPFVRLLAPLFAFPLNRRLALAQLYRRDTKALAMWDALGDPEIVGLCGTDAHGWIAPEWNLRTWQVVLDPAPEAMPAASSDTSSGPTGALTPSSVVESLRSGRFFCLAGLVADGVPDFSFQAVTRAGAAISPGRSVSRGQLAALEVRSPRAAGGDGDPEPVATVLFRDGEEVRRTAEASLRHEDPEPGLWRVEVRLRVPGVFFGGRELPVLYSNRIEVTAAAAGSDR